MFMNICFYVSKQHIITNLLIYLGSNTNNFNTNLRNLVKFAIEVKILKSSKPALATLIFIYVSPI